MLKKKAKIHKPDNTTDQSYIHYNCKDYLYKIIDITDNYDMRRIDKYHLSLVGKIVNINAIEVGKPMIFSCVKSGTRRTRKNVWKTSKVENRCAILDKSSCVESCNIKTRNSIYYLIKE